MEKSYLDFNFQVKRIREQGFAKLKCFVKLKILMSTYLLTTPPYQ